MNIEELRDYCLSKKGTSEGFPFDETTLVFKVMDKIFAITDVEDKFGVNLKCDPEKAIDLREHYPEVKPGWHMNKKHWNTVDIYRNLSDSLIKEWVDHSYDLIVASLPKKKREEWKNL